MEPGELMAKGNKTSAQVAPVAVLLLLELLSSVLFKFSDCKSQTDMPNIARYSNLVQTTSLGVS
jgi:hypothetical protein